MVPFDNTNNTPNNHNKANYVYNNNNAWYLVQTLFFIISGERFSAHVLSTELTDRKGVCYHEVVVTGNGVADTVPVRCDMVNNILAEDDLLVVGPNVYSTTDKPNRMCRTPETANSETIPMAK